MARDEAAPFARGETYYNGEAIDSGNLGGINLEGKEYVIEGDDGRPVRLKVVRNSSSIALKPRRAVKFDTGSGVNVGTRVSGYTAAVGDVPAGVVDEKLPAAGVPANDLFYIVIEGPTEGVTVESGLTAISKGDRVVPGTGTSSTSDDAGKLQKQDVSGTAATLANNIQNVVGRAAAAQASTNTAVAIVAQFAHR
jgi:hypothetical protein